MASRKNKSYEPMPRYGHISAQLSRRAIVYSGWTQDYSVENRKRLQSVIELCDPNTEQWETKKCAGEAPVPGLRSAASASSSDALFTYGGLGGDDKFVSSLHQLSANTYRWSELSRQNTGGVSPMAKSGAGMIVCGDKLALLGGWGTPRGPT